MSTYWKTLAGELHYISCISQWKSLTGELYDTLCLRSGKVELDNSKIFHFYEVGKFNWRTLRYFMSTKWKSLTGELCEISFLQS